MLRPRKRLSRRPLGVTLIELLIAMSTGLTVIAAGVTFLSGTLSTATANLLRVRLHQDLQSVMAGISRDLVRAGEWGLADEAVLASATADLHFDAVSGSVTARATVPGGTAPVEAFGFANAAASLRGATLRALHGEGGALHRHDLVITGVPSPDRLTLAIPDGVPLDLTTVSAGRWSVRNPFAGVTVSEDGTCVLLRYDLDGDGAQGREEHFGFRLNTARTAIQSSTTATSCMAGNWDAVTDPALFRVARFDVHLLQTDPAVAGPRDGGPAAYALVLEARLAREPSLVRSLRHVVLTRNPALP
jgi:type II secretory pathway component PulJ